MAIEHVRPHHSTAASEVINTYSELDIGIYYDEAWCIDLCITEEGNHTPITSFEHVTTFIILAPVHEDFETLRADIATIYHAKKRRHGNGTGQKDPLMPDQLPTLIIQHGSLDSREPLELNSADFRYVLFRAMELAKGNRETNMILAVMPCTTLLDALKRLELAR